MFKKICISLVVIMILLGSLFNVSRVYAQVTPTDPIPTVTYDSATDPAPAPTSSNGVIGFKACAFNSGSGNNSNALKSCIEDVLKFLFVIGIFLMVFRIAYIGINKLNPEGGDEKEQVNLIRDVIIGLVLLGAPALVLGAVNQNLLNLNFLDFTGLTGGPRPQVATKSTANVKPVIRAPINPAYAPVGTLFEAATGTVNTSGGKVTSIGYTSGAGYRSTPVVTISGGGGSGAKASPVMQGGKVVGVNITNAGSGYTSTPTVTFEGGEVGEVTGDYQDAVLIDPIIQGVRLTNFEASLTSFVSLLDSDTSFLDPSKGGAFDITKQSIYKQLGAVIGLEASCRDVFTLPRYTEKDCDTLGVKGIEGRSFQDALAVVPNDIRKRFLGDINYYLGSDTGTTAVEFVNFKKIEIVPSGRPATSTSYQERIADRRVNVGCDGFVNFNCQTISQAQYTIHFCAQNYFNVEGAGVPVGFVTTECDNVISDNSGITEKGIYKKPTCYNFRQCTFEEIQTIIPKAKAFPARSKFKRSIKYI